MINQSRDQGIKGPRDQWIRDNYMLTIRGEGGTKHAIFSFAYHIQSVKSLKYLTQVCACEDKRERQDKRVNQ